MKSILILGLSFLCFNLSAQEVGRCDGAYQDDSYGVPVFDISITQEAEGKMRLCLSDDGNLMACFSGVSMSIKKPGLNYDNSRGNIIFDIPEGSKGKGGYIALDLADREGEAEISIFAKSGSWLGGYKKGDSLSYKLFVTCELEMQLK